ncbi:uncharacterized protein, partial [Mycetomoellerius zeteki]|uniref:uncharacterized protein n=1 Tax=Mycetomoellerius zeteki TaxID=64791 RepID=UPI00084E9B3A
MRTLIAKTLLNGFPQDSIAPSSKVQWILSRLITRQPILPLMDKYHVKGNGFTKDKPYVPSKWDHNITPMIDESVESIRNKKRLSQPQSTERTERRKYLLKKRKTNIRISNRDNPIHSQWICQPQ